MTVTDELFNNLADHPATPIPLSGSAIVQSDHQVWQSSGADGFWIKPLMEQPEQNMRTWLMKVDAGAYSPLHAHDQLEQIYVLEGTFYDQDNTYRPGDYVIRAPGTMHSAGSEDGSLVLLVYT